MNSEFILIDSPGTIVDDKRVRFVQDGSDEFDSLVNHLDQYNSIVLHGLFMPWQERILRAVPNQVIVAWVFWGGDIYCRRVFNQVFLSSRSKMLSFEQAVKRRLKHRQIGPAYEIPFDLLQRIDFCLTDVHEDFSFVKSFLKSNIKELWYNYYSVEETVGDLVDNVVDGNNILIGNSCTIECNHLDGFRKLRMFNLEDSKVIVPLSYGESWLRTRLLKEGKRRFGSSFYPLIDFKPRDEYNTLIKSCAIAIMPHYRQQAFGNILTALWLGTRVYLSEKNLLFPFFKRIGTVVFSLEHDLQKNNPFALQPLSNAEREQNRRALRAVYSKDVMRQKNLELVKVLNQ